MDQEFDRFVGIEIEDSSLSCVLRHLSFVCGVLSVELFSGVVLVFFGAVLENSFTRRGVFE